ncbi:MAG TPA: nickel pincer cofactor biosynthesis protein LarC [Clostridia bacterium]|nr:nickel pincer cofactor biosynthesis protein LarC [Clostridia bacterium]
MKILYYECKTGISGDMNLGALIDLGVNSNYLEKELKKLNIDEEFDLEVTKASKMGITGTKVDVVLKNQSLKKNDSHSHSHSHNHTDNHNHNHIHEHTHDNYHNDNHTHDHNRNFRMIKELIKTSDFNDYVKNLSIEMFRLIAEAEGKVHGKSLEAVHFHEVGATDSIIDIVGAAICLEYLDVEKVISTPVQLGGGFVNCAHGRIPVPAPATIEILKNVPVKTGLVDFETTTPTGAAILKSTVNRFVENLDFTVETIGYGLGTKDFEVPNVLRVFLGELNDDEVQEEQQVIVETNIDDMNCELYPYIEEKLLSKGALDVYKTSIMMKKGRPAVKLSVLALEKDLETIQKIIFEESTTAGIRWYPVHKVMLTRSFEKVNTKYGDIKVKNFYYNKRIIKSKPEFEECKRLALKHGVSINEVIESAQKNGERNE